MLLALMFSAAAVQPGFAAEPADQIAGGAARTPSVTTSLINRLAARGLLSKQDAAELKLLAEAEAAEARAQEAMLQAALAQAAAAQARLKAMMAMADSRQLDEPAATAQADPVEAPQAVESLPPPRVTPRVAHAPVRPRTTPVQPAPVVEAPVEEATTDAVVPSPTPARPRSTGATVAASATPQEPTEEETVPEDTVRVTYVPEVVKAQLREEIKQDVMAQAREENWANPRTFPEWISKVRLFGDVRFRYDAVKYPDGNDTSGLLLNFNAINTGAPQDITAGLTGGNFLPTLNADQNRSRLRLRARLGAAVDMGQNFSAGVRLATGETNSPVTQNQSLGAAGSGQGGNFSKYSVWLDRAFLKYEMGGMPDNDHTLSVGRFDNPFFSTSMVWADDLGFDGAVAQGRFSLGEDVTPFYAVGAFPVFNTDLNLASNQPTKFKSNDKWLYGTQLGTTWELGKDLSLKVAAAYYQFQNIEGKLSTAFVPRSAADAGDTDSSRPAFAQKGNTYMQLRKITPVAGDAASGGNQNGAINQFQYYGLATKFGVATANLRLDFNRFEPFQISLLGEFAKNRSFDAKAIEAVAENNYGTVSTAHPNGEFLGSDTAWLVGLSVGDVALKERWKWNVFLNYRRVGSDSLVDGFVDSDFGGGGTNVKGYTLGGNIALSSSVRFGLKWMSASQVTAAPPGPVFKNDTIQLDFTGKF